MESSAGKLQSERDLREYYGTRSWEGGFPARCHMELPRRQLAGKRILNVGCRRGKGVYKLSELVGPQGFVVGLDWDADAVGVAAAGIPGALERSGLTSCNMEFRRGFPEDLAAAGIGPCSVDMVYLNASLSLFADPMRALAECFRVLAPGGVLVGEGVVVLPGPSRPADRAAVAEAARALGNAVQAAPTRSALDAQLAAAGFDGIVIAEGSPVSPDAGRTVCESVPTVPDDDATYRLVALEARKPR